MKLSINTNGFDVNLRIPQDKCSHRSCSCRCGARLLWFSGTQGYRSGWCWCFSAASVSTPVLLQTPPEPWPLRAKTSLRSVTGFGATSKSTRSLERVCEWLDAAFGWRVMPMWKRGTYSLARQRKERLDGKMELLRAQLPICFLKRSKTDKNVTFVFL